MSMEMVEAAMHSLAPGVIPGRTVCQGHCTVEWSEVGKHIPSPESGLEKALQMSPTATSLYGEGDTGAEAPVMGPSQSENLLTHPPNTHILWVSHLRGHYSPLEGLLNQQLTDPTHQSRLRPEHLHLNQFLAVLMLLVRDHTLKTIVLGNSLVCRNGKWSLRIWC